MRHPFAATLLLAGICSALLSCNTNAPDTKQLVSIDTTALDTSVKPGDNFFRYANGNWLKTAVIPATESQAGVIMNLYNQTRDRLHAILDSAASGHFAAGSIEQKVGDFYASGMDSVTIDKLGYEPVKPILSDINAINSPATIMQFVGKQIAEGNNLLLGIGIGADDKNSNMNVAAFSQDGLGLPDRDYYFKTDSSTATLVKAYQQYAAKLFVLTGDDSTQADAKAQQVYVLEKQMAASHKTNVQLRDPQANYHKMAVADLQKTMPAIDWKTLFKTIGFNVDSVIVRQPEFYNKLNSLLTSVPVDTWKAYLRFHILNDASAALSSPFVQARFDFRKYLTGQTKMKPRWDRMYVATDGNLGDALGQLYVKKYFTEDAKKRMLDLVNNLQTAFEARIKKLDWMTDSTKQTAIEKLHRFIKKIGYPDKWRDYSKVTINRNRYFDNLQSCAKNEYEYQLSKLGKAVDKTEWGLTAPTINAYYNPSFNEIVFPAGILQPPLFNPDAEDAVNYGGIGSVIGHEMTHGFDDQGAQYDKEGNLVNWWTSSDNEKFKGKTKLITEQYNKFTVLDSLHVNGALTTGENIADFGGVSIAWDAYQLSKQAHDTTRVEGFTPAQRFFLAYAQIWRSKYKDEIVRQYINIDPHSPDMHRVNGPLMHFTPFYTAFNLQPGDKMFIPEQDRLKIW